MCREVIAYGLIDPGSNLSGGAVLSILKRHNGVVGVEGLKALVVISL